MQAELRAIQQGLEYKWLTYEDRVIYKGYINQDGKKEGPGIGITASG